MPTVDEKIAELKKRIADIEARIRNLPSGFQGNIMRQTLEAALRSAKSTLTNLETEGRTREEAEEGLKETTEQTDVALERVQEIIDRIAKEGVLGTEGLEKVLTARTEAVEKARGARNRQLARSAQAVAQRTSGRLGPRSGAASNIVLNKALAPSIAGTIQGGAEEAEFEADLIRANEISKTLDPLRATQYISSFLQNRYSNLSERDISLRGLAQDESQFDRRLRLEQQDREDDGFSFTDVLSVIPGVGETYRAFFPRGDKG